MRARRFSLVAALCLLLAVLTTGCFESSDPGTAAPPPGGGSDPPGDEDPPPEGCDNTWGGMTWDDCNWG